MKTPTPRTTRKGLTRSLSRRGVRDDKAPAVTRHTTALADPSACTRCGAVYTRRTWRREGRVTGALLARAAWTVCPACAQVRTGEYFGRVRLRGAYVVGHEQVIRRRLANVARRAEHTQPERRTIEVTPTPDGLDVLTTSQKLAHRIAHELRKAFGGRTTYRWSDADGSLLAVWQRADRSA